MNPLPLILAGALAAAEAAPGAPTPSVGVAPAAGPGAQAEPVPRATRPRESWGFVSLGGNGLRFDGIPVTLGSVRLGIAALGATPPGGTVRLGAGLFFEGSGGQTENGLRTGMLVGGPHVILGAGRFRASAGVELGATSIRRATDGITEFLATGLFRGALEADLLDLDRATLYASVDGTFGGGGDVPFRGLGAFLGLRF